jgi:two-component system, OmpR family, sensor histidine kinase VanS
MGHGRTAARIRLFAGAVLLAAGYFSLSRGGHPRVIFMVRSHADLLREFAPTAAIVMAFVLVFGLVGGWFLAGRMLAPLTRITDATRTAATGSLSHRFQLEGRSDEFRELADAFDAMLARLEAHVTEQQRFAANGSHELRTPLATTQTLLDVARNGQTAPTAGLSTASTSSTPEQSTSPKRCSCSAAPTGGPSSENTPTCRS